MSTNAKAATTEKIEMGTGNVFADLQTAELVALPLAERLRAMEELWDSLCRDQTQAHAVPAWHREETRQ